MPFISVIWWILAKHKHKFKTLIPYRSADYLNKRPNRASIAPKPKLPKALPPMFFNLRINMAWWNLREGHLSTKSFENRHDTFWGEDFLSFHFGHLRQNCPTLWRPCFSTNQHGLNESGRGSPNEHSYKINWKSAEQFWRRFFKFSL